MEIEQGNFGIKSKINADSNVLNTTILQAQDSVMELEKEIKTLFVSLKLLTEDLNKILEVLDRKSDTGHAHNEIISQVIFYNFTVSNKSNSSFTALAQVHIGTNSNLGGIVVRISVSSRAVN